jgi:serine phosphatase RsbU (regulator of sigma subunit)
MSLRLRLIVAFFILSVVPLAAVTLFTYASNARAMRDAAGREAQFLAGELTQRMQMVTAQLSERVGHLMDLEEVRQAAASAGADASTAAQRREQAAAAAAPAPEAAAAQTEAQVAQALGEMAMLLNNVELRGLRSSRWAPPRGGRGRGEVPAASGAPSGTAQRGERAGFPAEGRRQPSPQAPAGREAARAPGPPAEPSGAPAAPLAPAPPEPVSPIPQTATAPGVTPAPPAPAPEPGRTPAPAPAPGPAPAMPEGVTVEPDRIMIDVAPLRRELLRQFVPEGQWDQLSDEERRRIVGEVNQRMMGIAQGIQMGAAEAKKRAEEAQQAAAARSKALEAAGASQQARQQRAASPALAPGTRRRTALSGNRLGVTVERNGEVLRAVNVDLNLPNVLATVFGTTRRAEGEIPFAVGKDGRLYTPTDAERARIEAIGGDFTRPDAPPGITRVGDWIVVSTEDPTGSGLKFGIARPVGDSLDELRRTSVRNALVGLGFIGLALIGIVPISSRLTSKLSRLNDAVRRIAHGDYSARVDISSRDEVGQLAAAFNQMAADVEFHQRSAVERERIRRELELGRQIQNDMLPQAPLRLGATEIAGISVPAREVGGDFFNYFVLDDGRVALLVGDVSGKGVGAALLMANIQASLRTRLELGQHLQAVADEIDRDIEESARGALYATLVIGTLDPTSRVLTYVNAGHHPQYIVHRDGTLDRMTASGLPVGLIAGRGYVEEQFVLTPGDRLFFYTDGCVETENEEGDMFGAERLERLLAASAGDTDLLARVEAEVTAFRGTREPFDDATMMVVKIG